MTDYCSDQAEFHMSVTLNNLSMVVCVCLWPIIQAESATVPTFSGQPLWAALQR